MTPDRWAVIGYCAAPLLAAVLVLAIARRAGRRRQYPRTAHGPLASGTVRVLRPGDPRGQAANGSSDEKGGQSA